MSRLTGGLIIYANNFQFRETIIFNSSIDSKSKVNLRVPLLSLAALMLILVILPFSAYSTEVTELSIESISKQKTDIASQNLSPRIQVITSYPAVAVSGISDEDYSFIQAVDYSNYFVVVAFFGSGSAYQDRVLNIYQFKHVVWVRSDISTPSTDSATASHYQIIKVDKTGMNSFGETTFRLLNEFQEKAKVVENISPAAISSGFTAG